MLCKLFHPIFLITAFITLGACTQAYIALNKAKAMGARPMAFLVYKPWDYNHGFFSMQEEK